MIACAAGSCGDEAASAGGGPFAATLDELERLAFVRAGRTTRATALDVGSPVDLVVDRFEVTWAHWDAAAPDPACVPQAFRPEERYASLEAVPEGWVGDVPVVGVTIEEADAFAATRGMRLPTFEEWMWCATGTFGRRTPSGRSQVNIANTLELRIGAPLPVGSFEAGRTPDTGLYDLVGNSWEWVRARQEGPATTWSVVNAESWPQGRWRTMEARCVGGSFLSPRRPLYDVATRSTFSAARSPRHRASDVGFRCVAPAEEFLRARARALDGVPATGVDDARARAIGARWGARATRALERALEAEPSSALLRGLLAGAEAER